MALSVYLLVAVPATFASSLLSFGSTFSAARSRRSVRFICALSLFASIINGVFVGYVHSIDQQPPPPNATDRFWAIIMIVTFALSALGLWRAFFYPLRLHHDDNRNA